MTPTRSIERLIRSYIAEGAGLVSRLVIPGDQSGPAPTDPYATCLLLDSRQAGVNPTWGEFDGDQVQGRTIVSIRGRYSVQFYRSGSRDRGERFRRWADSPLGVLAAGRRGLTFLECGEVRQIDSIVSEAWEQRVALELSLGYSQRVEQALGRIEGIDIGFLPATEPGSIEVRINGA